MMRKLSLILLLAILLSSCGDTSGGSIDDVELGMTVKEVRNILGAPYDVDYSFDTIDFHYIGGQIIFKQGVVVYIVEYD